MKIQRERWANVRGGEQQVNHFILDAIQFSVEVNRQNTIKATANSINSSHLLTNHLT